MREETVMVPTLQGYLEAQLTSIMKRHQQLSKPLKHQLIFFVVAVIVVFNTFMPPWIFLSMPRIPWEVHPSEQV